MKITILNTKRANREKQAIYLTSAKDAAQRKIIPPAAKSFVREKKSRDFEKTLLTYFCVSEYILIHQTGC